MRTCVLLLLLVSMLAAAPNPQPTCSGFLVMSTWPTLVVAPIVAGRDANTRVEVWFYNPEHDPTSELEWTRIIENVPQGHALVWDYEHIRGQHPIAMQVYQFGNLRDGWLSNPKCWTPVNFSR